MRSEQAALSELENEVQSKIQHSEFYKSAILIIHAEWCTVNILITCAPWKGHNFWKKNMFYHI